MDFRDGHPYVSLVDRLAQAKQWPVLQVVSGQERTQTRGYLTELFQTALRYHDDELAAAVFGWLVDWARDQYLLPFTEPAKRGRVCRWKPEVNGLLKRFAAEPSRIALELWPGLPTKGPGKCRVWVAQDESHLEDCDAPTLQTTKKTLLETIARRWRETNDEAEAGQLLTVFVDHAPAFAEERKLVEQVLREATGHGCSPARLLRSYPLLIERSQSGWGSSHAKQLARIVAIAWARNLPLEELRAAFAVLQTITQDRRDPSFPAHQLLAENAQQYAALEQRLRGLRKVLSPEFFAKSFRYVYHSPTEVSVVRELVAEWGRVDKRPLDREFEELRDRIEAWRAANRDIVVRLRITMRRNHADGTDKPLYEREERLHRSVGRAPTKS
jgi:hypothetical protein